MLRKLRPRSIYDVMAAVGCFAALATGTAYAANTIRSTDIVDGEVKSADVKDQSLTTFDVSTFLGADVVDGSLTEADIADETLTGTEVKTASLTGIDIAASTIGSFNIADFTQRDEDVGQSVAVNFPADIGTVNASSCVNKVVSGLNAFGDHLLLTPSLADAHGALMYDARYDVSTQNAIIHVCNWSNASINDATTHFNLLVIDAQS